MTAVSMFAFSE